MDKRDASLRVAAGADPAFHCDLFSGWHLPGEGIDDADVLHTKSLFLVLAAAMYLSRKLTHHSLPEIGAAFGGKDHTTILHAFKKIDLIAHSNHDVKKMIDDLCFVLLE